VARYAPKTLRAENIRNKQMGRIAFLKKKWDTVSLDFGMGPLHFTKKM